MTMLLLSGWMFRVKPINKSKTAFEIDSIPKSLGYSDVGEWLQEEFTDAKDIKARLVKGAKLKCIHDNSSVLEDDPRFNRQANIAGDDPEFDNEPEFAVVLKPKNDYWPEDTYLCAMMVNAPEGEIYRYVATSVYGLAESEWQGTPDEWLRMPEAHAAQVEKAEKGWAEQRKKMKTPEPSTAWMK